jgi:hypothetical protein
MSTTSTPSETEKSTPPEPLRKPNDANEPWLLRRVWDRLNKRNEHFMMAIVGREGSGKSYTAIRIADAIDPRFDAQNVLFEVDELLRRLRDGDFEQGDMLVLDEAGVSFGKRTWQDRSQVLANQALQLIRSHNIGIITTLPRATELDSQYAGRLQCYYEITNKVPDEYVEGKWKFLDPDRTFADGTTYEKYPRRRESGWKKRIKNFAFAPPRDEVVVAYEEEKEEFQREMYEETLEELGDGDGDDDDGLTEPSEIAEDIRANGGAQQYVREINNGAQRILDKNAIGEDYGVGRKRAKRVKTQLLPEVGDVE